jgi:hypothetical protein
MSESLKVYSLDYLKEKKYSDNLTEDATRLECAGLVIEMTNQLAKKRLLHLTEDELQSLKSALVYAVIGDTPVGEAYANDKLLVIDSQENEYVAGIPVTPPDAIKEASSG